MEEILDLYSDYLICTNGAATATGLSALLSGDISHDAVTRYLNGSENGSKELWRIVKNIVRTKETEDGVLLLDDTISEKPSTDENSIVRWHYSHAKGRCVKGINIISCLVQYGNVNIPICYEIVHKDIEYLDQELQKVKFKSDTTKNEMFRKLIKTAQDCNVKFKYIMADNWFGAKESMDYIQYNLKKYFIIGIKSNRTIALSKEDKKKGRFQKLSDLELKDGKSIIVYLRGIEYPLIIVKKIFTNEDKSVGCLYLVTNDMQLKDDTIYEIYQKRWKIEEYHKSIKQNTGLSKSPTKTPKSQKNHIFASLCAFFKLEILKFKTATNHFAIKCKLLLSANKAAYEKLQKFAFLYHPA